jgi:exonuclease SbcC
MLSPGFDPSTLNGSELLNELGEALAGSPVELDAAIADVVGLPYDQFVKCVVLPQGEFAAFLHAKPAERQEILVRLLGLDVYEKIRDRATTLVTEATAQLAATEPVLADLTAAATDAHLSDADIALKAAQGLTDKVERALPKVATVQEKADAAAKAVAEADQRLALLGLVRPLAGAASLAAAAQQAPPASLTRQSPSAPRRSTRRSCATSSTAGPTPLRSRPSSTCTRNAPRRRPGCPHWTKSSPRCPRSTPPRKRRSNKPKRRPPTRRKRSPRHSKRW